MTTLEIILIIVVVVMVLCIVGFFVIGKICHNISLRRNSFASQVINKAYKVAAKMYRVDRKWWDKVTEEVFEYSSIKNKLQPKKTINLKAHLIRRPSKNVAIIVHGYFQDFREMQPYVKMFYDFGFNCIFPELRANGESEGDQAGMGWLEREDIMELINITNDMFEDCKIVVFGISMGATTTCLLSELNLLKNVVGLISDCAYDNLYDQFKHIAEYALGASSSPLLPLLDAYTKITEGYSLKQVNACEALKKNKLPILFFHGDKDDVVPYEMVYKLYDSVKPELRDIMVVNGANHSQSYPLKPKKYKEKVLLFLQKVGLK